MTTIHNGTFTDQPTETRFQTTARTMRLPFVRLYGVLFMLVALAYSIANPLFLDPAENATLSVMLGVTLLVAGGYVAASFWRDYVQNRSADNARNPARTMPRHSRPPPAA